MPVRSWPKWSRRIPTIIAHGIGHGHARVFMEFRWQSRSDADASGIAAWQEYLNRLGRGIHAAVLSDAGCTSIWPVTAAEIGGASRCYDLGPNIGRNMSCRAFAAGYFWISSAVFFMKILPDSFSVSAWK